MTMFSPVAGGGAGVLLSEFSNHVQYFAFSPSQAWLVDRVDIGKKNVFQMLGCFFNAFLDIQKKIYMETNVFLSRFFVWKKLNPSWRSEQSKWLYHDNDISYNVSCCNDNRKKKNVLLNKYIIKKSNAF